MNYVIMKLEEQKAKRVLAWWASLVNPLIWGNPKKNYWEKMLHFLPNLNKKNEILQWAEAQIDTFKKVLKELKMKSPYYRGIARDLGTHLVLYWESASVSMRYIKLSIFPIHIVMEWDIGNDESSTFMGLDKFISR